MPLFSNWLTVGDAATVSQVAVNTALFTATTNSWFSDSWGTAPTAATTATGSVWFPQGATVYYTQQSLSQQVVQAMAMQTYNQQQAYEHQLRGTPFRRERPAAPAVLRHPIGDDAKQRARALLLEHLTPEQQRMLDENKWFIVEGGRSKTRYRIQANGSLVANVDVMVNERVTHRLCAHCAPSAIPLGDHLLAQKMMLEFAEDEFLRIANRHGA